MTWHNTLQYSICQGNVSVNGSVVCFLSWPCDDLATCPGYTPALTWLREDCCICYAYFTH